MNAIDVDQLGKRYRLGKERSPWSGWPRLSRLAAKLTGASAEPEKRAREIWALKEVSFALEPGTILGVIGPNGAGKTTLLKILARITPPTEGRVRGRGRVIPLLELGGGFHPDLTGRENVFLAAAMYGIPRGEAARRLDEIVEFAQLSEFIDEPVRRYSSGMYLRLAFSVAVNMQPEILLADEVLAVGDLAFQERCLERVREAGRAGMTVLFVSHDMAAVGRLCDRVLWLSTGRIVQLGEPQEVIGAYAHSAWTLSGNKLREGKKGAHASKLGEILSVKLVNRKGSEIGAVRISEDVLIKITFNMLRGDVSVRCAFSVSTQGIYVFRSVQPEEFAVAKPGIYSALVRIPAHLLADTIYSLKTSLIVVEKGKEYPPLVIDNALTFQVYDTDESLSARGTYKGKISGVVMPRLDWKVAKERDVTRG